MGKINFKISILLMFFISELAMAQQQVLDCREVMSNTPTDLINNEQPETPFLMFDETYYRFSDGREISTVNEKYMYAMIYMTVASGISNASKALPIKIVNIEYLDDATPMIYAQIGSPIRAIRVLTDSEVQSLTPFEKAKGTFLNGKNLAQDYVKKIKRKGTRR